MNISEYTKRLGIDTSPKVAPLDIEAGKAGYDQYLADVDKFKKSQQQIISQSNNNKSWWDKVSGIILQANGMSSQMSDNPISSGFNQAVEAYKDMPDTNKPTDDWTDEERWTFGEKYAKDKNEAYSFAEQLNAQHAKDKKAKQSEKLSKMASRNLGTGMLGSAASLGLNATLGSLGFIDSLAQYAGRGEILEHDILMPHEISGAIQGGIAEKLNEKGGTINENVPILGGKGWGDVYGLGMSLGQTALLAPTGSLGTLASYFGMSASQGVTDALARGATSEQALAMGVVSGLAEAIPEMISVDKVIGITSAKGVQNLFKNVLKQAGQEAGEEFTTSVINELADTWIMGGKSNYQQKVNELVASGMSLTQAKNRAFTLTLEGLAYDTLLGFLSGGISGSVATGINRVNQQFLQTDKNAKAKEILKPEQKKLIEEGKKYDTTKKRAEALEKKLTDGKELSGYELRMLAGEVTNAQRSADVDTVRKAIVERMKAEGVSDSRAKVLGEIALNKAIGNEVSKVQDLMLQRDTSAMKVYNQMSEDMMKSGLGDSAWTENTPLEKLRAKKRADEPTISEQRVQSGIDRLKADIAARYGVDTHEYKINMQSIEGKFGEIENKIVYEPAADSKLHVDGISSSLTQDDIIELSAIEKIANELGINIHVYETTVDENGERSYVDKDGMRTSDSGFYDPSDNSIHIDLRAGENGEGTMLYTASHEVVHFIKKNASKHYDALEALVTKKLVKGGYSIDKLIDEQKKKLIESEKQKLIKEGVDPNTMSAEAFDNLARERIGETNLENIAREEMVAEACQSFLASKNAVAEIKALKTKNKGLWNALKKFFTSLFTKINNVYKTVPPDSAEGKYIASMRKAVKPIRDAFLEGAVEAGKKANAKTTTIEKITAKEVKSQARVTSEQDAAYLDAVKRGDTETAQKMVEEAAKANGYTEKVFHGTRSGDFYVFDEERIGDNYGGYNAEGGAFDFTYDESRAWLWAGKAKGQGKTRVIKAFIKAEKPFYSYDGAVAKELFDLLPENISEDEKKYAMSYGVPFKEVLEQHGIDFKKAITSKGFDSYKMYRGDLGNIGVYSPYQIKSADPVTYDDNGNVIPLSERFNPEKKDIRHKARYTEYNKPITAEDIATLRSIGRKSINDFTSEEIEKAQKWAYKFYSELGEKSPFFRAWFGDWREYSNLPAELVSFAYGENGNINYETRSIKNKDMNRMITIDDNVIRDSLHYAAINGDQKQIKKLLGKIDEILGKGIFLDTQVSERNKSNKKGSTTFMHYLYTPVSINGAPFVAKLTVEEYDITGKTRAYNLQRIEMSALSRAQYSQLINENRGKYAYNADALSVSQLFGFVKTYDKEFKPKTVNPLLLNDDGTPKVFYHGTRSQFTEFILQDKPKFGRALGDGFYFTPNYSKAHQFANGLFSKGEDRGGIVMPVYLRMSNPFVIDENADRTKWRNEYHKGDYDGIIDLKNQTWYVEDSTQIKSATDNIGTFDYTEKDIRHKSRTRTYSQGQAAAMKANLSHQKVYSKSTAMKFVKAVAPGIKTKAFDELSKDLWIGLNTYTSLDDKQAFAKDMADMIVDRMLVDTEVKNSKWDEAVEKIAYLKPAIGTIKFREEDLPDLEHMLDKNGLRSLRARWGYKSKEGEHKRAYGLDEFITDLSREMPGMAYLADMHPTEAMIEVDNLYRKLKDTINQRYESAYEDATEEQIERWKSTIEAKILDVYEYYGNMSKMLQATSSTSEAVDAYLSTVPEGTEKPEKYFVDLLKQMDERISFWKAEKSKTEQISKWNGFIGNKAAEIRDYKNGAFLNATQYHPDIFKNSIEQLTAVTWRGNISPKGVRKVFAELKKWYTMENPMLYNKDNDDNLYSDQIAFYIDVLAADADVEKPLAADEYPMIYDVMNHLYTMMKNYGKIFRAGRWVDAAEIAKAYIGIIDKNDNTRNAWTRAQSLYNRQFLEPMALARQADNYNPDGFFTQTVEELRRAGINASIGEMRLRKEYDAFVDANQKYLMNAAKETVKYRGYDIPKLHLISLYMSMKRKQSREGLALNGFEYTMKTAWWDSEDVIKVPGYLPQSEKYNMDLINRATEEQMRIISENFTDTDRQYISILEKLFNEELRKLKIERDMERQGYTNALEGYYYPIIRGGIAKNIDTAKFTDINRATNSSFNKSTQEHAQQYLKIISADAMVNRHIKDMCKYYYMSQAIENYNVLYQIDTTEGEPNLNNPRNIAERLKVSKVWEKDFEYFKKLVADIQGIRENQYDSDGWRLVESLRGNYAKFALGLNAKVLFTQASSIIAAGDVIGFGSLMSLKKNAGLIATKEDIEKYCPIAAVRSYEQTALKAMTLTDKMGKVSEKLMVGISVMDDLVVRRLFSACQVEAKKRGAGELGTEDNKIVAGKILEEIILETQQNSYATEKSSAMRSANPLVRGLTMFTADGMKIISRIHDAAGELKVAKNSGNAAEIKKARKKLARSIAVAAAISVYLTGITTLFNWIYGRKKKEEEEKPLMKVHNFTTEVVGNFIGALPIVSELYDRIVNGFEVEDVVYDTINNLYGSISNLYKDATDMVDGKRDRTVEDLNRDLRSFLYAVGQVTGMPVRNVYNLTRGVIGHVSPKAGYYIDSKFENTSLVTDLKKAVKEGNNSKTAYIMGLIYDERLDDRVSEAQSKEILRLYKKINDKEIEGYTVIPKDIPDEIKRDGVTIELTDSKKEKIVSEYSKVISAIDKLVSSSFYLAQTDDGRAYLIDYYHDKYYETAVNNALKFKDEKVAVYNAVGFSTYAKFAYVTRGIKSDKDKYGNTIPGSKKEKVTEAIEKASKDENKKLLYLASLGYSLTEEQKKKLCKHLNSLSISASKKKSLAESCNLTYKKGKIYP